MAKKKAIKISQVKRRNHIVHKVKNKTKSKSSKLIRPAVYHGIKPQNSKPPQSQQPEPDEEEDLTEDIMGMIEKDDLNFLEDATTRRSYEILKKIRLPREHSLPSKRKRDDNDDKLECEYEQEMNLAVTKSQKLLLPIKTKDGLIMRTTEIDEEEEERKRLEREILDKKKIEEKKLKKKKKKGEEEQVDEIEEEDDDTKYLNEVYQNSEPDSNKAVSSLSTVELLAYREELLRKRKFEIGILCAGLLEAPEMKVHNFKHLLEILKHDYSDVRLTVRKLAAVSLLEVFKDLLPSYEIKHQEPPPGFKLKRSTQSLQNYEKSLLKAYKLYLQSLERISKILRKKRGDSRPRDPKAESLGLVAVRCMTELLVTHPYFNFSPNVGQALIHFLDNRNAAVREMVSKGLRTVLKEDKRGELSLHIVRRINHLVRNKNHAVHPEVMSVLLALRLKDVNLDAEKQAEIKQKKLMSHKQRLLNLSKRERKQKKRLEEVEREMLETKAEENKQTKHKYLTEVTKTVFTIIFRVLKCAPSSRLLSVSLEALAKFAHCINLEFFQDLVNVLDRLLVDKNLGHVEQLHCVETVFTILSGQGEVLNIDPLRFYTHLYRCLVEVHGGGTNADALIVLRTLEKAVVARRRKMSMQRLLAFMKRLCTLTPHLMHGAALGYLSVIRSVLTQTKSCDVLLDTDSSHGQGVYQPELPEPEYCGASASVLWELVPLTQHYHPEVRQMARYIIMAEDKAPPPEIAKLSPSELAETYDGSQMVFRPAVPPPRKTCPRPHHGRLVFTDDTLNEYMQNVENSVDLKILQKWNIPGLDVPTPGQDAPALEAPKILAPEPDTPRLHALELRAPELRAPEQHAPELRAPELRAPELRAPELRAPELRAPELRAPELRAPGLPPPGMRSMLAQRWYTAAS